MGDTTPIPAPRRGLLGSPNLTVLVKFVLDQPLLPWQRKFENVNRKLAITRLVWEIRLVAINIALTHCYKLVSFLNLIKRMSRCTRIIPCILCYNL